MTNIVATPEILGTFITGEKATSKFAANPSAFLAGLGIEPNIKIKAVSNSADTMNLALPFYADLEKTAGAVVADADLESASGGGGDIAGNNAAVAVVNTITKIAVDVAKAVVGGVEGARPKILSASADDLLEGHYGTSPSGRSQDPRYK